MPGFGGRARCGLAVVLGMLAACTACAQAERLTVRLELKDFAEVDIEGFDDQSRRVVE